MKSGFMVILFVLGVFFAAGAGGWLVSMFNETVNIYNIQIEQFPQMLMASFMRYRPHPLLTQRREKKFEA